MHVGHLGWGKRPGVPIFSFDSPISPLVYPFLLLMHLPMGGRSVGRTVGPFRISNGLTNLCAHFEIPGISSFVFEALWSVYRPPPSFDVIIACHLQHKLIASIKLTVSVTLDIISKWDPFVYTLFQAIIDQLS